MIDYSAAGLLELNEPADAVYDEYGFTVEVRCVTSRGDNPDPHPDAMTTVTADSGVVWNGSPGSQHSPDPNNPGDFKDGDGDGARFKWFVWTSTTTAVEIELVTIVVDGDVRWALFVQGEGPTP